MTLIFSLIFSYCFGSIPFGLIIGKLHDIDVRYNGSGNIGATNVMRLIGKKAAFVTLIMDILKGMIPIILISLFTDSIIIKLLSGVIVILGHIFPIWLNFRGGKGVATALGVMIVISPFVAIISIIVWLGIFKVTRVSSISSIISTLSAPMASIFVNDFIITLFIFLISILILYRHKDNLSRIKTGEEKKL